MIDKYTIDKIVSMVPAYEAFLKKVTKRTWRGKVLTGGSYLILKFMGKKGPTPAFAPQFISKIRYDQGTDLFDIKETFLDEEAIEHRVKEVDGIGIETFMNPAEFLSWIPAFMELKVKVRFKKTSDTKALLKAAKKTASKDFAEAFELIREGIEALREETGVSLEEDIQPEQVDEAFSSLKKKVRRVVRFAKKAKRAFKRADRKFQRAQKQGKRKFKQLKRAAKPVTKALKKRGKAKLKQFKKTYGKVKKQIAKKQKAKAAAKKKRGMATGTRRTRSDGSKVVKQADGSWKPA